jgi:glycosyltransferase involved in cell wall biosynthesis
MLLDHVATRTPVRDGRPIGHPSLQSLSILVLTLNEEKHIARCIESTRGVAERVIVVDSGSTDRTREIATELGAEVYANPWINHSGQVNWGLTHTGIQTEWVMRLDADEIITPGLQECLEKRLSALPPSTAGLTINRQIHFLGKWIKHGGIYPVRILRIWRDGRGKCEDRWMDEHIVVDGAISHLSADIADINLNNITWWIAKHNLYSSREAIELLRSQEPRQVTGLEGNVMSRQARVKRWVKNAIYAHMPLGLRSAAYFVYRYIVRLGFLDGWRGFVFHFLQGFWYRFVVDVKVYELKAKMKARKQTLKEAVKEEHGYEI